MEAKLRQHGEIAIVSIQGALEIERTQPFRDACNKHFLGEKVIFNLEQANFVGSTGIQSFLEAVKAVSEKTTTGVKLVGLKSEFKRIFSNCEIQGLVFYENEANAIDSYLLS
jgi:anti-anti-sigma factor